MEDLKNRISEALESVLSEVYTEKGIDNGDISPLDLLRWEALTEETAMLFEKLIQQNKPL